LLIPASIVGARDVPRCGGSIFVARRFFDATAGLCLMEIR
jgi:hypothetical protein